MVTLDCSRRALQWKRGKCSLILSEHSHHPCNQSPYCHRTCRSLFSLLRRSLSALSTSRAWPTASPRKRSSLSSDVTAVTYTHVKALVLSVHSTVMFLWGVSQTLVSRLYVLCLSSFLSFSDFSRRRLRADISSWYEKKSWNIYKLTN